MTDYVSKEELKEFFEGITITVAGRTRAEAISEVLKAIYNGAMKLPNTDAVPITRCKDCKHRFEGEKIPNCCDVLMKMSHWLVEIPVEDEWHCGSGERKEE